MMETDGTAMPFETERQDSEYVLAPIRLCYTRPKMREANKLL